MEQVSKLKKAVTQITSLHNDNKLTARSTADPKNSDNSDSVEDDEKNDRWNRVTNQETDCSLYNETDLEASFLSHQKTSSSSVATTCKLLDDSMMGSVFKKFSESYNQATVFTNSYNQATIPQPSCERKETVDIDILVTSRNGDRKTK